MVHLVMLLFTLGALEPPVVTDITTFESDTDRHAMWRCEELLDFMKLQQPGGDKWAVYACVIGDEDT